MRTHDVRGDGRGSARRLGAVLLVVGLLTTMTGCVGPVVKRAVQEIAAGPFYRVSSPLPAGEPGELIRSEEIITAPPDTRA